MLVDLFSTVSQSHFSFITKLLFLSQGLNPVSVESLCRKHDVWLHLEGHALAGLCLLDPTTPGVPTGDSLSLTIGSWLGVPALPFVTLYKVIVVEN